MNPRQVRAPRAIGRLGRALPPRGDEFISLEVASGLALVVATVVALAWANIDAGGYADIWSTDLGPLTAQAWVNEALMAAFFFVVGLEIKRELVEGALRTPQRAALPVIAALGGMVVPALVYTAWNAGGEGARGWGIPMATDIAFALGVLALLGKWVKPGAKALLLAVAIVDDIGAIIVIALFYSEDVAFVWLLGALGICALVVLMRRVGLSHPNVYLAPGIALWLCLHEAGIHATIAGVVLAFLLPATPGPEEGPVERLEHSLHPWTGFVVVPLFALANAGVALSGDVIERAASSAITIGVFTGLVAGKLVGIMLGAALAARTRIGAMPDGLRIADIAGVAALAGIGFTVSLFIADLSFAEARLEDAKIGVLMASLVAATLGAVLTLGRRP